jgi:nucleoside transporter
MPTQIFLGIVQLIGGVFLMLAAKATGFSNMLLLLALFSLVYAPTLALTNSLAFHHMKDEKDFGVIRVFGTLGWIVAGWILYYWRTKGWLPGTADCLMLAGIFSLIMGVFSFFLPHTPPSKDKAADPLAFREAFVLLKNPNFFVFMAIAFVVTTELQFYYGPTGGFLENALKINHDSISAVMSVAQIAEILAMAVFLPMALKKWGVRKTLAIGVIAWPLRYIVFAWAPYLDLGIAQKAVVSSLTLHGIGYAFFFVASQVFVDMVAPKDIRASAQSLLSFFTLGIGTVLGTYFTGWIMNTFKPELDAMNWTKVFLVPCALTVTCAIAFLLLFKDPEKQAASEAARAEV